MRLEGGARLTEPQAGERRNDEHVEGSEEWHEHE
jgi:hypothetical protein